MDPGPRVSLLVRRITRSENPSDDSLRRLYFLSEKLATDTDEDEDR